MARRPKPWYRKDRGVWCATINGKRHNLGPDKQGAYAQFYKLISQPRRQIKVESDSVATIFEAFLDWVERNRSPATYEWYQGRLKKFHERYPDLLVAELKPYHVENWATKPGQSVTTKRNNMRAVKKALKWAVSQGYLDSSPIAAMEIPAGVSKEVYLSREEFQRLLDHVPNPDFANLLRFVDQTGCRPQEAWKLEARHINLATRCVVFPAPEAKGGKKPRAVYLPDRAYEIIEPLMKRFPDGALFRNSRGRPWNKDSVGNMFDRVSIRMGKEEMRRRGEEFTETEIADFTKGLSKTKSVQGQLVEKTAAELKCEAKRKLIERRCRQLAKRYCLYAFRHTWGTDAVKQLVNPVVIAELMGHDDTNMLNKVYQHVDQDPKFMLEQAQKLARD